MKATKKNSRGPPKGTPEMKEEGSLKRSKTEFLTTILKIRNHHRYPRQLFGDIVFAEEETIVLAIFFRSSTIKRLAVSNEESQALFYSV